MSSGNHPSILVTGASGFVGRNFLEAARERFRIYALARRSQREAGVPGHPNITWIQADVANWPALKAIANRLRERGGADYLLHLAGYYDFTNEDHPEYVRTNVNGTRHVLEMGKLLFIQRFLFASSLAACSYPAPGLALREESPPDAVFPYARSKAVGEEMLRSYSTFFPCSAVRLAAVYSDWCEYAPLYVLLETWLGRRWNARILAGRGESAVPYIHVMDACSHFLSILRQSGALPPHGTYIASPDGSTGHRELYEAATWAHFGAPSRPVPLPRPIVAPGLVVRDLLGRLVGRRPFERPWMIQHIDRRLTADASHSRRALSWAPTPRRNILRRIPFLTEGRRRRPHEWNFRNQLALRRETARPALVIHDTLLARREENVSRIAGTIHRDEKGDRFPHYRRMSAADLRWHVGIIYQLLLAVVRTEDRTLMLDYMGELARRRFEMGFPPGEVREALSVVNQVLLDELRKRPETHDLQETVRHRVTMTLQLAMDELEDSYDLFLRKEEQAAAAPNTRLPDSKELERIIDDLNVFYRRQPERNGG
jgi:nucleoside-diphosphate-sugar epimerase